MIGSVLLAFAGALELLVPNAYDIHLLRLSLGITHHVVARLLPTLCGMMIGALQVFDSIIVLTQGGPGDASRSLVMYIYENAFQLFHMGYASATAITLFIVIMLLTLVQFRVGQSWVHYE